MRPHPDEGTLALHALGEPALTGEDVEHVRGCAECTRTVEELSRTVDVVRGPRARDLDAVEVPDRVWDGVAAGLGLSPDVRPASARVPAPAGLLEGPADVADLAAARSRRPGWGLLAVAAAGLVVGAAGTLLVTGLPGGDPEPETAQLAAADLVEFGSGEGTGANGSAVLVAAAAPAVDDGAGLGERTLLQVQLDGLPDTGQDFLEAWLIDADSGAMVSLGPVPLATAGSATADLFVPPGLDVGRFSLVDVSSEPPDGVPTHSGASLVRGTLEL
ncbi:anti-sigma factor [Aquipuribacter sp. SD81]|uniref:anti-sigma factor n=1 Tax=Aquipuribacter sp. SD81 TaxID=3127703 RepID=UPI003019C536